MLRDSIEGLERGLYIRLLGSASAQERRLPSSDPRRRGMADSLVYG